MKREIKMLLIIVCALTVLGAANQVRSQTIFESEDGCLVPYAYYDAATDTMVGLIVWDSAGAVYWSFMSPEGAQLSHGVIAIGAYKLSFSLRTADTNAHSGQMGYLIFTWDDDGVLETGEDRSNVAANAVLLSTNDAAFLPVVPLDREDYANANLNLSNLNANSIIALSNGQPGDVTVSVNYWIDPAFNAETSIVIWTTQTPPAGFAGEAYSVDDYIGDEVTFAREHNRLNVYDVGTEAVGFESGAVDGCVDISENQGGDRIIFSFIKSTAFSATQTMLGLY
jgi:hypothetical protein